MRAAVRDTSYNHLHLQAKSISAAGSHASFDKRRFRKEMAPQRQQQVRTGSCSWKKDDPDSDEPEDDQQFNNTNTARSIFDPFSNNNKVIENNANLFNAGEEETSRGGRSDNN